jgi:hypothetical protein
MFFKKVRNKPGRMLLVPETACKKPETGVPPDQNTCHNNGISPWFSRAKSTISILKDTTSLR